MASSLSSTVTAQDVSHEDAIDRRIDTLLAGMTIDEKAGQLTQFAAGILTGPGSNRSNEEELVRRGEVGSLLNVADAKRANDLQHIAVTESRLHIPLIFGFDVIHGERTIFPIPLGLASSFDPALVEQVSRVAADEARADGIDWVFSPMVDIARDARWGRIAESSGEDPYLGSAMARAYVRGYQGKSLSDPDSVAACVKHFAAYGASLTGRDYNTVDMSHTQLRQVYLQPYHAPSMQARQTLMTAFSTINGVPPTANQPLLTGILRDEWGFKGFVVSDWNAVDELVPHAVAADDRDAAQLAITAKPVRLPPRPKDGRVATSKSSSVRRSSRIASDRPRLSTRRTGNFARVASERSSPLVPSSPADAPPARLLPPRSFHHPAEPVWT